MSWGPIQLRLKGSRQVEFDGEASPAPGGGSMPIEVVRVPIAFDTPDLVLTGITLYTPTVGDVLLEGSIVSVPTAWNGTGPTLWLWADTGATAYNSDYFASFNLKHADQNANSSAQVTVPGSTSVVDQAGPGAGGLPIVDASPLKATVNDNAGGDPGSTQGVGEIILVIAKAS